MKNILRHILVAANIIVFSFIVTDAGAVSYNEKLSFNKLVSNLLTSQFFVIVNDKGCGY